jgi:hypothetical protein
MCGTDMSFEGESSTVNFYASPSCIRMLEPGTHTIKFENSPGSNNALAIKTSLNWAVIAEVGGGGNTGGGGGASWVDVPTTDTADFDTSCVYRIDVSPLDGNYNYATSV